MRILLAASALAVLMSPAAASATSWYRVAVGDTTVMYVDLDSFKNVGGNIEVLTQSVYAKPLDGDIYAAQVRTVYHCSAGYFRTTEYSYIDEDGNIFLTEASVTINEKKTAKPGSINQGAFDFVCKGVGGTRISDDPMDDAYAELGL
ncbi:surface-adhesin E family protein [Sphingomonas canadensis]|uniref:Surface-adhesin E family protein n=1 Tax=Sphingomonas canadensis TaxID=1219257 RepID=A0ABW3H785_9SPHN|nr:surface-adhesin E family protein [Sphingomonas canadensis]MCW3835950.1 hypothetical protein [Sphingomonas canadensis]